MEEEIRTFICVELPEELKEEISRLQARLKMQSGCMSWARPGNIHLTLKFLGNVGAQRLPEIVEVVTEVGSHHPVFTLTPASQGVFPHLRNPRVFWLGIRDDSGTLKRIQHEIEEGLAELGFARESREFTPHITIGRVRPYRRPRDLTNAFLKDPFSSEPFLVDHITVMRSELKPTGAVYTPLRIVNLQEALNR